MRSKLFVSFLVPSAVVSFVPSNGRKVVSTVHMATKQNSWSAADDWNSMSSESAHNAVADSNKIFNQDLTANAAQEMGQDEYTNEGDDAWVSSQVDSIHHNGFYFEPSSDDDNTKLYDTGFDEGVKKMNFMDEMGREISMLVHCNQSPDELLIHEGRALPPLTQQERNDVSQLVIMKDNSYQPTPFFQAAITKMFQQHATSNSDDVAILDSFSVAKWMTTCLKDEGTVGPFDKRVVSSIARFGNHGTGCLTLENFEQLYLTAVTTAIKGQHAAAKPKSHWSATSMPQKRNKQQQEPSLDGIWRDIRNHGMQSPVDTERARLQQEIHAKTNQQNINLPTTKEELWDECEILEYQDTFQNNNVEANSKNKGKSSHELVELASDNKTPKWIRDGDFVFIDEQTCIGCNQCAHVSPSSFLMLENGRARTYAQRSAPDVAMAVASCPVNCMMRVSFRELKEMEIARDEGNWDVVDRRHLNHRKGNIPLNVAGMDSDANHRSSWYHYLKQKCHMSKNCPQRGCYDCPHYKAPGENPYFKKLHQQAEHVRAMEFSDSPWRKTADL